MSAPSHVEWAVAGSALPGESLSGDSYLVEEGPHGALFAVVDGLGHGLEASRAASEATRILKQSPWLPLGQLLARCHEALHSTRGAALALAAVDCRASQLRWLSVGNVEGVLLHAATHAEPKRHGIRQRGGVLGFSLPAIREEVLDWRPGDLLLLATDGLHVRFTQEGWTTEAPSPLAKLLLSRHGRGNDDALVLVARNRGPTR